MLHGAGRFTYIWWVNPGFQRFSASFVALFKGKKYKTAMVFAPKYRWVPGAAFVFLQAVPGIAENGRSLRFKMIPKSWLWIFVWHLFWKKKHIWDEDPERLFSIIFSDMLKLLKGWPPGSWHRLLVWCVHQHRKQQLNKWYPIWKFPKMGVPPNHPF